MEITLPVHEQVLAFEAAMEDLGGAVTEREIPGTAGWRLIAHCTVEPDREMLEARIRLAASAAGVAAPNVSIEALPPTDWVADYQDRIGPQAVARFFIYPSHHTGGVPQGAVGIRLDAGLAFGTGEHESTKGCLMALDRLADGRTIGHALDMGCGSGILAIAAAKLWHARVLACDIDPAAVALAAENAGHNGVAALVEAIESDGYGAAPIGARAPFDLITANVLAGPLIDMAGTLAQHLAPRGAAVLSGILAEQADPVLAAHTDHGLVMQDRIDLGDWSTLVLAHAGKTAP